MAIEFASALSDKYQARQNDQVRISAEVGSGQPGVISSFIDGVPVNSKPNVWEQLLGSGGALAGKKLLCVTTVNDVRKETNLTRVGYSIKGGPNPKQVAHEYTASAHGNTVIFTAEFLFEKLA